MKELLIVVFTVVATVLIEVAALKLYAKKLQNKKYLTWEEYVEAAKKDGVRINLTNDEKGNDVDKFFNGEKIEVNFIDKILDPDFCLPGTVYVQFEKDE